MNKVLSILLSLVLIYGSITPSLAQVGNLAKGGKKALSVAIRRDAVLRVTSQAAHVPVRIRASYFSRINTALAVPGQTLRYNVSHGTQRARQAQQNTLDLTSENFTHKEALVTFQNLRKAQNNADLSAAYLTVFPYFHLTRGFELTNSDYLAALNYTRREAASYLDQETPKFGSANEWGRNMAVISNLGIYGTATDAGLIVAICKNVPAKFTAYTDVIASRALLSLDATAELQELAALRTVNEALPAHWQGIADYVNAHALPVELPAVATGRVPALNAEAKKFLTEWNPLNLHHENISSQATEDWLALREDAKARIISDEAGQLITQGPDRPAIQNGLTIETTTAADGLALSATEIPLNAQEGAAAAPADLSSAGGVSATEGEGVEGAAAPSAPTAPVAPAKSWFGRMVDGFSTGWKTRSDNSTAKRILTQTEPLPSLLKQIIESQAADKWKELAFVRLYNQGILQGIIEKLPADAQRQLQALWQSGNTELFGKKMLNFYKDGIISEDIARISNARNQEALVADLDNLVAGSDWAALAQKAYGNTPITQANFSGAVPPVPKVDKEEVKATFRPEGWADRHRGAHTEKNGKLYFENGIPFYYRNSRRELSSKPVGILSQEQANLYGRFLSKIGLADAPGMFIEQGFVLALDEMGQWKLVMPNGNRAIVEANPKSKKLLEEIQRNGSKQIAVNTPYSSSDLLAMANLLEHNPDLNLELVMSAPDSMNRFLTVLGTYIGLDSAGALTGPFKSTLKGLEGLANMMGNLVGGVGYMSPWAGGAMAGIMTKAGSVKTLKWLFGASILGLGYSFLPEALGGLGMTGFQSLESLKSIPLALMALPMVTAVFAGSLLGTQMNVFLNYFKDPVARTSAHLRFAETKQWSRLGLVTLTAGLGFAGGNWSVVVPIALTLATFSAALLYNTPVYREFKNAKALAEAAAQKEADRLAKLSPEARQAELAQTQRLEAALKKASDLYKPLFKSQGEVKDIGFRVKMVYASYAASLMMLGQTSSELFGTTWGQGLVGAFMLSTAMMRRFASKMVSGNKMTDNQLTGMSLPLLALTAAGLATVPYTGMAGLAALGALGILHYVATAVPGQLDAARLQNLVSAELSKRKQAVTDYEGMDAAQREAASQTWDELDQLIFQLPTKEERLDFLQGVEKNWAGKATRDYSYFNGHGLVGILAAAGAGYLFMDLGPQWTKGMLETVGSFMGDSAPMVTLNRLILGYSATVAGILAWKNRGLTKDFFSLFNKKKITAETISSGQVQPKDFGLTLETKDRQLVKVRKDLKGLEKQLVNYGINSERKLTRHLQTLIRVHNRFTAAQELELANGADGISSALQADFASLQTALQQYRALLETSDPSIMLQREFETLANALCEDGVALTTLRSRAVYMPEGSYSLPAEYNKYEDASQLVNELNQLAGEIISGNRVSKNTYRLFITYQTRVNDLLTAYRKANPADSVRVLRQQTKLNAIIQELKRYDAASNLLEERARGLIDSQDVQELRDVLAGYAD